MRVENIFRFGILLFMATSSVPAIVSSGEDFKTLTGLEGRWAIRSETGVLPIEMVYEGGSKGSIVTERFGKELSVFYQDHGSVMMIHFCNAGNQPRLRLSPNSVSGLLQFDAFEVSNLERPDAAHVHRIIYRILNQKRIDLEIVWLDKGSQTSEKYRLTKI